MTTVIDRSAVSRALAKAIAYKACGKELEARRWARELVYLLECADILAPVAINQPGRSPSEEEELLNDPNWVGSRHHY